MSRKGTEATLLLNTQTPSVNSDPRPPQAVDRNHMLLKVHALREFMELAINAYFAHPMTAPHFFVPMATVSGIMGAQTVAHLTPEIVSGTSLGLGGFVGLLSCCLSGTKDTEPLKKIYRDLYVIEQILAPEKTIPPKLLEEINKQLQLLFPSDDTHYNANFARRHFPAAFTSIFATGLTSAKAIYLLAPFMCAHFGPAGTCAAATAVGASMAYANARYATTKLNVDETVAKLKEAIEKIERIPGYKDAAEGIDVSQAHVRPSTCVSTCGFFCGCSSPLVILEATTAAPHGDYLSAPESRGMK